MSKRRLIYNNWIAETGAAGRSARAWSRPDDLSGDNLPEDIQRRRELEDAVRRAVESLPPDNRELIIRYYFMGESLGHISEVSGRRKSKLVALLRRTHRMLKKRLIGPLGKGCRIPHNPAETCPVCRCADRAEINLLIKNRDPARTWRPVMAALRQRYGLQVRAPQVLISHEKYHLT